MSSEEIAISVRGVSKHYVMFDRPEDRMRQMVWPRLQRLFGREPQRYYRDFAALNDVSFDVRRGEAVGIVGRNGSGKSTLLQIVCGILQPTSGQVQVNGRISALLELGAGFNPEFTGRENVYLNAAIMGMERAEVDARFDDIAAFADIGHFINQPVKSYSSGMFVRLAFASAINVDPDILVVDEALSVGDEAFQRKCFARIEAMRSRGVTIVFVSHSASTVIELCEQAVLLDAGELLADGRPKDVVRLYHKLLFSTPERACAIREEIRLARTHEGDGLAPSDPDEGVPADAAEVAEAADAQDPAYFDEGLLVVDTLAYDSLGACIEGVEVRTPEGRRVNVLTPGSAYVYRYRVRFDRPAVGVRFGMMIKTVTGLELSGAVSAAQGAAFEYVAADSAVEVEFRFRCLLVPGIYFMNAGVLAAGDEGEAYIHRRIDVMMFRVSPQPGRLATGLVDLDVEPMVRFDHPTEGSPGQAHSGERPEEGRE